MAAGPVQLIVLGFPHPNFQGEIIAELERPRESDTIRGDRRPGRVQGPQHCDLWSHRKNARAVPVRASPSVEASTESHRHWGFSK
jgi:hypothetical protein